MKRAEASAIDIAVIGAGPVGLALALHASRVLPHARISLFDRRDAAQDVRADPRTLALSLGSVQLLQRLGAWPADAAQPIREVHVSQLPPTLAMLPFGMPEVRIRAAEEGVPMLGAVLRYGQLVAPLQQAWLQAVQQAPQRLASRFGTSGERAEGAARRRGAGRRHRRALRPGAWWPKAACSRSRRARRWRTTTARPPGSARPRCDGGTPGLAIERFTRHGPLALLPLRRDRRATPARAPRGAGVVRARRRRSGARARRRAAPGGAEHAAARAWPGASPVCRR